MRKLKTCQPRSLPFHLLLIVAGALVLMAAFAPRANATLIAYFNFEGPTGPPFPVNLGSQVPPGAVQVLMSTNYNPNNMSATIGLPENLAAGDPDPNLIAMGLRRSSLNDPANFDIPLPSLRGIYDATSVSFAIGANGNGFALASVQMSTNAGGTFATISGPQLIPSGPGTVMTFAIAPGTTLNVPRLVLRLNFTGGQSNGNDLQDVIDNIQINGTIVPEPTTVVGGLLGVLGLCWLQRRRLIRSVRFRRT
jgi:hypothetical protein